jgi:RNA polymerase sigma-70 factor (ECF subfamily)
MLNRTEAAPLTIKVFDLARVIADDSTFRGWYEAVAPRVYAYLYSRCGNVSVAEELTQETFIEVVRNPRTYDGRTDPVPWLIGVARHRLARHLQRASRQEQATTQVREIAPPPEETGQWRSREERELIERALGRLPQAQRAVLMLRFVDDLPIRDIARTIGRSEDATESLLRRARLAFEDAYNEARDV